MGAGGDGGALVGAKAEQAPAFVKTGVHGVYLLPNLDAEKFREDIMACVEAVGPETQEDADHFQRLVRIVQLLNVVGHLLGFVAALDYASGSNRCALTYTVAFVAAALISTGRSAAWVVIGHHVMHGGYTGLAKQGKVPGRFRRGVFAIGAYRRCIDWIDWMMPEAWNLEHNKLHHYKLSEDADPDCVERNFEKFRNANLPTALKWLPMPIFLVGWKYIYYSTNCLKQLKLSQKNSWVCRNWPTHENAQKHSAPLVLQNFPGEIIHALVHGRPLAAWFWFVFGMQWLWTVSPMLLSVFSPMLTLTAAGHAGIPGFGQDTAAKAASFMMWVCIVGELGSNAHTFIIVACNHAGDDLFRFSTSCQGGTAEFLLRCSYAGVNFECGNDFIDIMYGWLNYQIEHHMFPDMTHLQYRKLQPLVKEVCRRHNVLYIQENALWRTYKTFRVAVGTETMQRATAVLPRNKEVRMGWGSTADTRPGIDSTRNRILEG